MFVIKIKRFSYLITHEDCPKNPFLLVEPYQFYITANKILQRCVIAMILQHYLSSIPFLQRCVYPAMFSHDIYDFESSILGSLSPQIFTPIPSRLVIDLSMDSVGAVSPLLSIILLCPLPAHFSTDTKASSFLRRLYALKIHFWLNFGTFMTVFFLPFPFDPLEICYNLIHPFISKNAKGGS